MFVADASVVLEWLLPGQASAVSLKAYALAQRGPLVVPVLWVWETQNAILTHVRRKMLTPDRALEITLELSILSVRMDDAPAKQVIHQTWDIAVKNMMTFYDAAYVELALRLGLKLASTDRSIRTTAARMKVELV